MLTKPDVELIQRKQHCALRRILFTRNNSQCSKPLCDLLHGERLQEELLSLEEFQLQSQWLVNCVCHLI